jgi:hypothetical protein
MDTYMVMMLNVYASPPVHGFGVYKTRDDAEKAIDAALIVQPNVTRSFYHIFKITMEAPIDIGVIEQS